MKKWLRYASDREGAFEEEDATADSSHGKLVCVWFIVMCKD